MKPTASIKRWFSRGARATLAVSCLVALACSASGALTHRYSFTSNADDSIGAANGVAFGNITYANNEAVFPGGAIGESYIELPPGLISNYTAVTFEFWCNVGAAAQWSEIYGFGNISAGGGTGANMLMFTPNSAGPDYRMSYASGDPGYTQEFVATATPVLNNAGPVCITCVYDPPNNTMTMYRNGVRVANLSPVTAAGVTPQFGLQNVYNVYSWLGRSLYSADGPYVGTLNEFRIYDSALSAIQAAVNFKTGPDQLPIDPGALVSLSVDATNMNAGATQQAQLLGNFQNINGVPLTPYASNWVSSDPSIISVDAVSGLLTSGASSGTTTISAEYAGLVGSKQLSVTAVVTNLAINAPAQIVVGAARLFTVTAKFSDGSTSDLTAQCTYTSSDDNVLTVISPATGRKIAAKATGTATITASFQSQQAQKSITAVALSLTHRWSFDEIDTTNTNIVDSVGGANGYIVQGAAAASGYNGSGALLLDGQGGYAEFPQLNLFSDYGAATFETWVTDNGSGNWARIYDFGNSVGGAGQQGGGTRYMFLSLPSGVSGTLRGAYTITGGGAGEQVLQMPGRPGVFQKSHIVWTSRGADNFGALYVDGVLVATNGAMTLTPEDVGPTTNNWLGRAQFNDPPFYGDYDEFRTYNGALDPLTIALNSVAGPGVLNPTPGPLNSLALTISSPTTVGDNQQAILMGTFANYANVPLTTLGAPQVTYSSSNTKVATVSPLGVISAVGPGSSTITATATINGVTVNTQQTLVVNDVPVTLTHRWSFNDTPGSPQIADLADPATPGAPQGNFQLNGTQGVFDGVAGTYVLLPPDMFIDYNSITFEVWFTDQGSGTWARLIDIGADTGHYMFLDAVGPANNMRAAFNAGAGEGENVLGYGARPPINVPHHAVFTQDAVSRTAKLYIDGRLVAQDPYFPARPRDVGPTPASFIGKAQYPDPYFWGTIDEVRTYRGAVSADRVALNYAAGPDNYLASPSVSGVAVTATNMTAGNLQQAVATATISGIPVNVTALATNWTSSNPAVAKVSKTGVITAVGAGTATISATYGVTGTSAAITVAAATPGLVHRYSFSGNANDSAGSAHGTLAAGATIAGNQLVLNGAADAYVTLPGTILSGLTETTIEAWFTYASTNNGGARLWDIGDTAATNYVSYVPRSAADNTAVRYRWHGSLGEANLTMTGTAGANDPKTHVAVVLSPVNGFVKLYVNGTWRETFNWTAPLTGFSNVVAYIGKAVTAATPPGNFIGTVDELRIWNGSLDQLAVASSYAAGPDNALVSPGAATSLGIVLTDPAMVLGTKQRPRVSANFAAVANLDLSAYPGVVFTSANPAIVAVTPDDQLEARATGTTAITAAFGGQSVQVPVTVTPKQLTLTHRYNFNGNGYDTVGNATATLFGQAAFVNNSLYLPGVRNPQSHAELPRDIVSGFDAVTIEAWTTVDPSIAGWQRLWDFGNHQNAGGLDYVFFSPFSGASDARMGLRLDSALIPEAVVTTLPPLRGRTLQVACTIDEAANLMRIYTNGVLANTYSGPLPTKISLINDVYNFLGRAQFNDPWFKGYIDEFRIYYGAMSATEVAASFATGANPDQLSFQVNNSDLSLSWTDSMVTRGFVLETAPTLSGPWSNAPGSPTLSGGKYTQTVPIGPNAAFFRLVR